MTMGKTLKPGFKINDYVYAKIKGYPPWPAKITKMINPKKFSVLFYGTAETGNVKPEDLFYYSEFKEKYNVEKHLKKQNFSEAVKQIERAIAGYDAGPIDINTIQAEESKPAVVESAKKEEVEEPVEEADVEPETQSAKKTIVINKKKAAVIKPKEAEPSSSMQEEAVVPAAPINDTIKVEETNDVENNPEAAQHKKGKPIARVTATVSAVSRSGRKLKPSKRLLDNGSNDEESLVEAKPKKPKVSEIKSDIKEDECDSDAFDAEIGKQIADKYLLAVPPSEDVLIGIKLMSPSENLETEIANDWYSNCKAEAEKLREEIQCGELDYKSIDPEKYVINPLISQEDNYRALTYIRVSKHLQAEAEFRECTQEIRLSLGLQADTIDFPKCRRNLEKLNNITYTQVLLLKHADCFLTIKRLRAYVGNKKNWTMTPKEVSDFDATAGEIRIQASILYDRLANMFTCLPGAKKFWEEYIDLVTKYEDAVKHLSPSKRRKNITMPFEIEDTLLAPSINDETLVTSTLDENEIQDESSEDVIRIPAVKINQKATTSEQD